MEVLSSEALDHQYFSREQRLYDDTTTWLAEVLDGGMRTPFEFNFDGHEIYGQDGSSLGSIFKDSLIDAENLPVNLGFEWRRRILELEEYHEMVSMMRGAEHNTMVMVSDFPPELMDAEESVGGYNVSRKQTMLRIITKSDENTLLMRTQTLDRSDRASLEAIYDWCGYEAADGELLGQRMQLDLGDDEQELIIDHLMGVYDRSLQQLYGGDWQAGRQKHRTLVNTYDFVRSQSDLVDHYIESVNKFGDNLSLLSSVAATMSRRYKEGAVHHYDSKSDMYRYSARRATLEDEIMAADAWAVSTGEQFDGCGLSLPADAGSAEARLGEAGYGNKSKEATKYSFNKKMHCVVCQAPPKTDSEPKKMCGPCGICRSCDNKLK